MEYRFGPDKGPFLGTSDEWMKLRNTVAQFEQIDRTSIKVKCPHCGRINYHTFKEISGHVECDSLSYNTDRNLVVYNCPGYVLIT